MDKDTINQIKTLKDTVQGALERLQSNITPDEFLNGIKNEMQEFIFNPKWPEIIGTIPFDSLSALYNSLTTHISFYNDAVNNGNEQKMELESNEIKKFAQHIIRNLNSNIETMEKGQRIVRRENVEEAVRSEGEIKAASAGEDPGIYVSTGKQSVISRERPVTGTETKTKNLNIRLDSLLFNLGKLITQIDNWDNLTKTTKIELLGLSSSAYVTLVENYQESWSDLISDLRTDYQIVWNKVEDNSDQLIANFEKLIEWINDVKNSRYSITLIKKEVRNEVSTIIEIVRQNGDSN